LCNYIVIWRAIPYIRLSVFILTKLPSYAGFSILILRWQQQHFCQHK
jgi:Na+/H+ antiporter NhaC